jgi:alpha-ribazole phosphatase
LMRIYLVRHPPPVGVDGLCYGRLEVPVDEQAIGAAAESVFAQIPNQTHESVLVYSSPSSRCMGLARRLASPREPTSTDDLMEMNFGDWQGTRWDSIAREKIDEWAKDAWGYRPGGGESAEMVATRWERWVNQVREVNTDAVIAVTHAGVIRVALSRSGLLSNPPGLGAHIPFGSVHPIPARDARCEPSQGEDTHA